MLYILLPSYNEKKNLKKIFLKLENLKKKLKFVVILVDDCSTDNTKKLLNSKFNFKIIYLRHKINRGLSITLETGFKKIEKICNKDDKVITLDSDNTHPVDLIYNMNKTLDRNDIVIASRFVTGSKVYGVPYHRIIMSYGAKFLFEFFYKHKNLNDYTCNYRGYKFFLIKEILKKKTFFKHEEFNIAAKILIFLVKKYQNLKLKELPLILNYDYKVGQSKMKIFKTIFLTLRLIFKKDY